MTMDEYENSISGIDEHVAQQNVQERVYSIDKYVNLMKEILDVIVYDTHFMSEKELDYDRLLFQRLTSEVLSGKSNRSEDIRTCAELMTRIVKDGGIRYSGFLKPNKCSCGTKG